MVKEVKLEKGVGDFLDLKSELMGQMHGTICLVLIICTFLHVHKLKKFWQWNLMLYLAIVSVVSSYCWVIG